jgi:hypothetical protein
MGADGGRLLVSLLNETSPAKYSSTKIIETLSNTGWVGAAEYLRQLLTSIAGSRLSETENASLVALARLLGNDASADMVPYLSDRRASLRSTAWQVVGCVGDLTIFEDVWPIWGQGLRRLHRGQQSIQDELPNMLLYWARHARSVGSEVLVAIARGIRKESAVISNLQMKVNETRVANGVAPLEVSLFYGYWPEIKMGSLESVDQLLPAPGRVAEWRRTSFLIEPYWPHDPGVS